MSFLKEQRVNISPNVSKVQAENALRSILFNDQVIDAFCSKYKYELAMIPPELEILLGCSRSERLRWTKEKKLPIVYFMDIYKFGSHLMCPMYDRRIIGLKVTDIILAEWRNEWIRRRRKKYRVGDKQDISNESILQTAFNKYLDLLCDKWYSLDLELGTTFELAYWLSILDYWIKVRKQRSTTSRTHYYKHKTIENIFTGYKNSVLKILLKSKYTTIYKCEPLIKDRYTLHLCNEHDTYVYNKDLGIIHAFEDFYINPEKYKQCSKCQIIKRLEYFSTYYIEVSSELDNSFLFTFTLPYTLSSGLNSNKVICEKKHNIGTFRNGRESIKNDIYIPSERRTVATLKALLINAKRFFINKRE